MKTYSLLLMLSLCSTAGAVNTLFSEHSTEKEFKEGVAENILINSQGILSLAPETHIVTIEQENPWVINDLVADSQGNLYAASSGEGKIYQLKDDNTLESIFCQDDISHVFALAVTSNDALLAGTGGNKGELYLIEKDKFSKIWTSDKVSYIWDIIISATGRVYLATGPEGIIYATDSEGKATQELFDSPVSNILSLALSKDGMLYAGTDSAGLVYKIDLATNAVTVAYDTGKEEVSSLAIDQTGNIYIATAGSAAARPGAKLILSENNPPQSTPETGSDEQNSMTADAKIENTSPATTARIRKPQPSQPDDNNNMVVKLVPEGFVEKIFSGPVVIHDLALDESANKLYIATGIEGKLLTLDLSDNSSAELYDSQSSQISSLLLANNRIYAGCANAAALTIIENTPANEGYFISEPFDAGGPSAWGKLYLEGDNIADNISIFLRSGNTADPENGGWSQWQKGKLEGKCISSNIPTGRFLQYKLELKNSNTDQVCKISEVKASYSIANQKPVITDLDIERPEPKPEMPISELKKIAIRWQAVDINQDKLTADLLIKSRGSENWIKIAKELTVNQYIWDTALAPDGLYAIKIIVSDQLDNPAGSEMTAQKISQNILVDNTAPEISELTLTANDSKCHVLVNAVDAISVIAKVEYSLDSSPVFRSALCTDGLSDSNQEQYEFTLEPEESGSHIVTIKITDIAGNSKMLTKEFRN